MSTAAILLAQYWHHDRGDGWWILMAIGMVLFWGLVIVGAIWALRSLRADRRSPPAAPGSSAEEILDRRLAEGEIEIGEYRSRRAALERRGGD